MKSRFGEVNLMFEAKSLKASSRYSSLSVQQFVNAYNTDKGRPWLCLIENESSEKKQEKNPAVKKNFKQKITDWQKLKK